MRTKLLRPTMLALALVVVAGNAFGQFDERVLYRITAKHSGKCLAVANGPGAQSNGDRVIQWDCSESETNQKWNVVWVEGDYYRIVAKHSGKALDVFGGIFSRANGVVVQQWDFLGGDNQKWQIICAGEGYYQIKAKHSGKSLDINGGPQALDNGPHAQQWDFWGGDNQKWKFTESLADSPPALATRTVCPSAADQARLGVNLYTTDTSLRQRTSFRVGETVVLTVENNTPASIYAAQALDPARLIREEGLQVERLIDAYWVAVFPSGRCGPSEVRGTDPNGIGSVVFVDDALTRLTELRTTMNFSRRWTVPALVGPGTYRLAFVYHRSRNTQGPRSTVCSQTFAVR